MTCKSCVHWQPGALSKHGFAACARGPNWQFITHRFRCDKHETLDTEKLEKRIAWLAKKNIK